MAKTGNFGTHFALIAPHGPTQDGQQQVFSINYLFGKANIAYNFLLLV